MPTYRYLLTDLLTDDTLASLPLSGVSFDRRISRMGNLTGNLSVSNSAVAELAHKVQAYCGRSALWVYRDDALWWGGIPWTAPARQGERGAVALQLSAATFDSYAHRRILRVDKSYSVQDFGVVIPDLWNWLQSDQRGNIGVVAEDQPTGHSADWGLSYKASEQLFIGKIIENIGDTAYGPEHTIDVYVESDGTRTKRLRLANQLGGSLPTAVFQRSARGSGSVLEWSNGVDALTAGTTFQVRGDAPNGNVGEDVEPLLSNVVEREDLLNQGWPLLDVTEDMPMQPLWSALDDRAESLAAEFGGSVKTNGYTVQVGDSGWTPNRVGDPVRLKLRDLWHTNTDLTVRPVGCTVQVAEKGQPEKVTLMFGDDE